LLAPFSRRRRSARGALRAVRGGGRRLREGGHCARRRRQGPARPRALSAFACTKGDPVLERPKPVLLLHQGRGHLGGLVRGSGRPGRAP
jgi:hypothetical protein